MATPQQDQRYGELLVRAQELAQAAVDATGRHDKGTSGFAWVEIRPATSTFARWCKKNGHGHPASGGLSLNPPTNYQGQSIDVREAGAKAFAAVLTEAGINATAHSRID